MALPIQDQLSYKIGIICALSIEAAAVISALDEQHNRFPIPGDYNRYTLGKIGVHNIVVACLPPGSTGKANAATVGSDLRRSFPAVKIGLMVGIGGGVWSPKVDVRLGDVVVSQPNDQFGGVVQWDFGKMERDSVFYPTGHLDRPPPPLLAALGGIQIQHLTEESTLPDLLQQMRLKKPKWGNTIFHLGVEHDKLFQVSYPHHNTSAETCDECATGMLIDWRSKRATTDPQVHYGNIASGDKVIKDANFRDEVAKRGNIICFEMEAAGLMNSFPCIVIRGICDYADSHKNHKWQPYAAAVAAAYAKEFLGFVDEQGVDDLKTAMSPPSSSFTNSDVPVPELLHPKEASPSTTLFSQPNTAQNSSPSNHPSVKKKASGISATASPSHSPAPQSSSLPNRPKSAAGAPSLFQTLTGSEPHLFRGRSYWQQMTLESCRIYQQIFGRCAKVDKDKRYITFKSLEAQLPGHDVQSITQVWRRIAPTSYYLHRSYAVAVLYMLHIEKFVGNRPPLHEFESTGKFRWAKKQRLQRFDEWVWCECIVSHGDTRHRCGRIWTFANDIGLCREKDKHSKPCLAFEYYSQGRVPGSRGETQYLGVYDKWLKYLPDHILHDPWVKAAKKP